MTSQPRWFISESMSLPGKEVSQLPKVQSANGRLQPNNVSWQLSGLVLELVVGLAEDY